MKPLSLILLGLLSGYAHAGIVVDFQTSPVNQTAFPVSSTDLINSGIVSLWQHSEAGYVASAIDSYGPISALIDGDGGGITGFIPSPGGVMDLDGVWTFQVDLSVSYSPQGYDITKIQTFTGHTDNRKSQSYILWASLVGNDSFFQIGHFDYSFDNPNSGSTRLSIGDDSGVIASGVDAIRWDVQMPGSGFASVYREFDVFGSPSAAVPEPATAAIWVVLGACGAILSSVRRRVKDAVVNWTNS